MDVPYLFFHHIALVYLLPLLDRCDTHIMRQVCRQWKEMIDRVFSEHPEAFRRPFTLPLRLYQGRQRKFVGWLDYIAFDCQV